MMFRSKSDFPNFLSVVLVAFGTVTMKIALHFLFSISSLLNKPST